MPWRTLSGLVVCLTITMAAAPVCRSVTIADCIQMPWIVDDQVRLSPDASKVAYLVRKANLRSNQNVYRLFVRDLHKDGHLQNGKVIFYGEALSGLRWIDQGRTVAILSHNFGSSQIHLIDVTSGKRTIAVTYRDDITDFAVDSSGRTIAFAAAIPAARKHYSAVRSFVAFGVPYRDRLRNVIAPRSRLYLAIVGHDGKGGIAP